MLITSVPSPTTAAVTLSGRSDAHEVPTARPQLHNIVHTTPRGSVINLDTTARQLGVTMTMAAASDAVRTVLTLTGGLHDLAAA